MMTRTLLLFALAPLASIAFARDTTPPITSFTAPAENARVTDSEVSFSGIVTDEGGSGISRTRMVFYSFGRSRWFYPDGGDGSYAERLSRSQRTELSLASDAEGTWTATFVLPPDDYQVYSVSYDNAGNRTSRWTRRRISVIDGLGLPPAPPEF